MIARQSQLFIPTLREAPADAEAVSHKLLVRGGYIRQVGAGVWTFLPLGWRVHQKVVQIIREEMDAIGGQEMLMPVLTPAELWEPLGATTRRSSGSRIAPGARYVLPMTHEETVTFHAREIQSYRQLPQILYHFAIKERDEPRSRGGLLRMREFIMKDAYSFDRDEEVSREASSFIGRRTTACSSACGLEFSEVRGRVRDDGWQGVGRLPLSRRVGREHARHVRERRLRGRPRDRARCSTNASLSRAAEAPKEVATPGVTTIEALAELLGIDRLGDLEGDAGRDDGRDARARSRSRRRSAVRVEDARRARERLSAGDR